MSIYQSLQLNAAGSKSLIQNAETKKEKLKYTALYLLKIFLTQVFCILVVSAYSSLLGPENSIVGVVVILSILTYRQTDLGIRPLHGSAAILMIFGILMTGPHLSNLAGSFAAFWINALCLLCIMVLGTHNVIMFNHIILNLCYFLLQGNDVSQSSLTARTIGLAAGGIFCALIYYITHRNLQYKRGLMDIFAEFRLTACRTRWQLKLAIIPSVCVFLAACLNIPRSMWIAFAAVSLLPPFEKDSYYKVMRRVPFNIAGCTVFALLSFLLPKSLLSYLGMLGGIGVGFSATYSWQTMFNTFGALTAATALFSLKSAIILRILTNVLGCVIAVILSRLLSQLWSFLTRSCDEDEIVV